MLAHAVARQTKDTGKLVLLAGYQSRASLHAKRKVVPYVGSWPPQTPVSSSIDPPPNTSKFSDTSNSLRKIIKSPVRNTPGNSPFSDSSLLGVGAPKAIQHPNHHSNGSESIPKVVPPSLQNRSLRQGLNNNLVLATIPPRQTRDNFGMNQAGHPTDIAIDIGRLGRIQSSADVSSPTDSDEHEARSIARKIASMDPPPSNRSADFALTASGPAINRSRRISWCKVADVRRAFNPGVFEVPTNVGAGFPLSNSLRSFMEPRFHADLGHVRIHTGEQAAQLSKRLHARAFTVGENIFFGKDQYQPGNKTGLELMAHEIAHTFQQGTTIRRSEMAGAATSLPEEEGGLLRKGLDYLAEHVNDIPGFQMFTIIIGVNPINMRKVQSSPADIMRALIRLIPIAGPKVAEVLDNHRIFDRVAIWASEQVNTLGNIAESTYRAVISFAKSVAGSASDIYDLLSGGSKWAEAKRLFTGPIQQIENFAVGLVTGIVELVKEAILIPLAALAAKTPFWDLLVGVLGKNPITEEEVPRSPEVLIGGFMKLIGKEDVWQRMQETNAVDRAWAWFQSTMSALLNYVGRIPDLAIKAFDALQLEDIIMVKTAFDKVAGVFGTFVSDFTTWALDAVWNLLEIIFDVVSPGALEYVKRTGAAIKSILQNPMPFVGNLVNAAKLGFQNFADHFLDHLKAGLINWLTDSLPGVYIPKALTLPEIVKLAFSVLGISWQNVRQKLVKVVGENVIKAMEIGIPIVVTLVIEGPAAAWAQIKEQLADLRDQVFSGIMNMVVDAVVKKAIPKLISMFVPGAGFISAIVSIYDTVMVFVNKLAQIGQVVVGFINSIVAIANGDIGGAASKVETILAGVLSLAINFLAGFAGLGKVADKVLEIIKKVRTKVDQALDKLVDWIVKMAKKLFAKVFVKKDKDDKKDAKPDERSTEQKEKDLHEALAQGDKLLRDNTISIDEVEEKLHTIKNTYRLKIFEVVIEKETDEEEIVHIHAEVNSPPEGNTPSREIQDQIVNLPSQEPFGPRPNFKKSVKEQLPVESGEHRRHIDGWQTMVERLRLTIDGKKMKVALRNLKMLGQKAKKTIKGIQEAGRKYLIIQFNNTENLWVGPGEGPGQNSSLGSNANIALNKIHEAIESGNEKEFESAIEMFAWTSYDPDKKGDKKGFDVNWTQQTIKSLRRKFEQRKAELEKSTMAGNQ